jgi:hypothetical protein
MTKVARESESEVGLVSDAPEVAEEFGLRVVWQSEDERIEAAAFLIATRLQEGVRRRVAKHALDLREQNSEKFSAFVAQHTGD